MKKIVTYLFVLGLMFSACNPLEDINKEIDEANPIMNQHKGLEMTISADDYTSLKGDIATNQYFSEMNPSKTYIPTLLAEKYPSLTLGSSVKVTYKYRNEADYLNNFTNPETYTLSESDYALVSELVGEAGYLSPSNSADEYLPSILESSVTGAANGDLFLVSYQYFGKDPDPAQAGGATLLDETFDSDLGAFQTVNVTGDKDWYASSYSGDGYAKMSGYSGGAQENEDWLISPQIDLTGSYAAAAMNFTQTVNFLNGQWNQLKVLVSKDYNGVDPATATWDTLTVNNLPTGSDYDFVNSGDIDLSSYLGSKINIAFRYNSSTSNAATWEITAITVTAGININTSTISELYTKTSSGWIKPYNLYYLKTEDYDAMGESSGRPGRYNNFSSSILPQDYLPQFVSNMYPFSQEGDTAIIVYKYFSGSTITKADKLTFIGGNWHVVLSKTDQYVLSSSGWVFDPTINYSMTKDDYQIIVDYVKSDVGESYITKYGDSETYYGTNAYYGEFQVGETNFDHDAFATWQDAATEAIGKGFLPGKFPNSPAQVDGVDLNYKITFGAYVSGQMIYYSITFKCTKAGPNPTFEYVEGPTLE